MGIQPSSSGRSAELLGGATGFIGFGALHDLGYVPAASQGTHTDDSTISAEFRVTLRKMTKKDPTTKIKVSHNSHLDNLHIYFNYLFGITSEYRMGWEFYTWAPSLELSQLSYNFFNFYILFSFTVSSLGTFHSFTNLML